MPRPLLYLDEDVGHSIAVGLRYRGVEGQDIEQVVLGNDAEFWRMILERRRQPTMLTSDDIRQHFGLETTGRYRTSKAKPRRSRRTPRKKQMSR